MTEREPVTRPCHVQAVDRHPDHETHWHCPPPGWAESFRVIEQHWTDDYTQRHIYSIVIDEHCAGTGKPPNLPGEHDGLCTACNMLHPTDPTTGHTAPHPPPARP